MRTTFELNVSVVIYQKNKFLLIKRSEDEDVFPGYWGIPGGEVEADDSSLESALNRECKEEINVEITYPELVSNNIVVRNEKNILYMAYKAKLKSGAPEPKDGTEEIVWKDIEQAKIMKLTPKTLDILEIVNEQERKK